MKEKPIAFLSLVKLLEEVVGNDTSFALLDPFSCKTLRDSKPEVVAIQKAGKVIAQHLGLDDYMFVIAVMAQKPNIAAHIELDRSGRDVFVELSPDLCQYPDAVLATLCHELSHKFLHKHAIRNGSATIEQEFLTEVTAVYLGLGKLMLNGCECQISKQTTQGGQTFTETTKITTGYISRDCFAFVYRLVCAMRGIPKDVLMKGLCEAARQAVDNAESKFKEWFKPELSSIGGIASLVDALTGMVETCQDEAAARQRALRIVDRKLSYLMMNINESHKPLMKAQLEVASLSALAPNPHLRFLNCLQVRASVVEALDSRDLKIKQVLSEWTHVEAMASWEHQMARGDESEIVNCPLDGSKLRVPSGRQRLLVTCACCKYKFLVSTDHAPTAPSLKRKITRKFKWNIYPALTCLCLAFLIAGYIAGQHGVEAGDGEEPFILNGLGARVHSFLADHFSHESIEPRSDNFSR